MEWECINGSMVMFMMVLSNKAFNLARAHSSPEIRDGNTLENGLMAKCQDRAPVGGRMVQFMRDLGSTASNKVTRDN